LNIYIYIYIYDISSLRVNITVKSTHSYYCPTERLTAAKNTDLRKS